MKLLNPHWVLIFESRKPPIMTNQTAQRLRSGNIQPFQIIQSIFLLSYLFTSLSIARFKLYLFFTCHKNKIKQMKIRSMNHLNLESAFIQGSILKTRHQISVNQLNQHQNQISSISSKGKQKLDTLNNFHGQQVQKCENLSSIENDILNQENLDQLTGRWSSEQHQKFLIAHDFYPKDWKKIASIVKSRSPSQVRSHAQKYFNRIQKYNAKNYYCGKLDQKMRLRQRHKTKKYQQLETQEPHSNYNRKIRKQNKEKRNYNQQSKNINKKQNKFYGDSILQKFRSDLNQTIHHIPNQQYQYQENDNNFNKKYPHKNSLFSIPSTQTFTSPISQAEKNHFFIPICNQKQIMIVDKSQYHHFAQLVAERDPEQNIFYQFVRQLQFINLFYMGNSDNKSQTESVKNNVKNSSKISIFSQFESKSEEIKYPVLTIINNAQNPKNEMIQEDVQGKRQNSYRGKI